MIEILISFVTNKRLEIEEKMMDRPSEIRTRDLSIQKLSLCPSSHGVPRIFVVICSYFIIVYRWSWYDNSYHNNPNE